MTEKRYQSILDAIVQGDDAADLAQVRVDVPRFEPFDQWLKGRPEAETILRTRE